MVELADWMEKGTRVTAIDKPGQITKIEKSGLINGVRFVKYIYVKLDGGTLANPYYPEFIKPIKKR
jgi:hypothetical protein